LRQRASNGLHRLEDRASRGFNNMRQRASNGFNNLRQRASNGFNNMRQRASNGLNNMRQRANNGLNNVRNRFDTARQNVANRFNNLRQKAVTGLENLGNRATTGLQNFQKKTADNLARFENWAGKKVQLWGDRAKQIAHGMTPQNVANLAADLTSLKTGLPNPNRIQNERVASQMTRPNNNPRDQELAAYMALRVAYDPNASGFNPSRVPGFEGFKQDAVSIQRDGHARMHMISNPQTKEAIFAIRGTDPNLGDWAYNGKTLPVPDRVFPNGNVHLGLRQKVDSFWADPNVRKEIDAALKGGYKITLTGHSQGGGDAVVLAARIDEYARSQGLKPNLNIITYEGMRAGDEKFARSVMERIPNFTRVEMSGDVVPRLPPGMWSAGTAVRAPCGSMNPVTCHGGRTVWNQYINNLPQQEVSPGGRRLDFDTPIQGY
jgi:ElaB/YqjD/DUF883 family membrane-anchored ribosome-binding protein